jgi:hypothetical protein
MPTQMAGTTRRRSREARFAVGALLTSDAIVNLLHVLPHIGSSGPFPPQHFGGASRWTIIDINRGGSQSPSDNGCVGSSGSITKASNSPPSGAGAMEE